MSSYNDLNTANKLQMRLGLNLFVCTICEKPVNKSESYSHGGSNLICVHCLNRVSKVFGIPQPELLSKLHR